jgi:hypothetical protein
MKFRTKIEAISTNQKVLLGDKVLTIGSCFANNIGQKLVEQKLECLVNPFGTVFDPLSIIRLLNWSIKNELPPTNSYVQSDGIYKNLHLHSSFSGSSVDELALQIRAKLDQTHRQLKTANWLVITFGTAFVYRHKVLDTSVTNCQKLPAKEFSKSLIELKEIKQHYDQFIKELKIFNPNLTIILTVSPVRHIKDGLADNAVSKATLRLLTQYLEHTHTHTTYYPAYEIMLDDLRDYRFYKQDMIHPNEQAIDYLWNHFSSSYFDKNLLQFKENWQKVLSALNHRPFNSTSESHQLFLKKLLKNLDELPSEVDVSKEIAQVKNQIFE